MWSMLQVWPQEWSRSAGEKVGYNDEALHVKMQKSWKYLHKYSICLHKARKKKAYCSICTVAWLFRFNCCTNVQGRIYLLSYHRDLDHSVFVSLFRELFLIMYTTLSSVGSRDLVRQWPAVHDQNKQRFLNETSKTRWYVNY